MSAYDSWLEKPYRDRDAAHARFERHLETCEFCVRIARDRHLAECRDCDHDWHAEACTVWDCDCELPDFLSDKYISEMQNKCFEDDEAGRYADYCDRKYDEWKDRER